MQEKGKSIIRRGKYIYHMRRSKYIYPKTKGKYIRGRGKLLVTGLTCIIGKLLVTGLTHIRGKLLVTGLTRISLAVSDALITPVNTILLSVTQEVPVYAEGVSLTCH